MPGFGKPKGFTHKIDVKRERAALRAHRQVRGVPKREPGHLLLATWNIANLGAPDQVREPECFVLLAEIVASFDLVAVQEVRDNTTAIYELMAELPESWRLLFSESGGNNERFAFLWDSDVVSLGELVGKVTFDPKSLVKAGGKGFVAFSRTPYLGTFHAGKLVIELVSVHSFFGEPNDPIDMARRLAETRAIGWWCEKQSKNPDSYTKDIIALGDFNTPTAEDFDVASAMLDGLKKRGLHAPQHKSNGDLVSTETQIGTAVRSENHYDQLLFFPLNTDADLEDTGVFDFDAVIFKDLWKQRSRTEFHNYVIWAISDHRPMWARLKAPG